jgi:carbamate kinase
MTTPPPGARERVVVALGGNALAVRGEPITAEGARRHARAAAAALAPLFYRLDVVVTHGNGPQVGRLLRETEHDPDGLPPTPLDVVGAESEGMIGYVLEQELVRALPGRAVATLLTQTIVDAADPRLARPSKPVGAVYPADAEEALRARGYDLVREPGGVRRVVPSPEPVALVEAHAVSVLVDAGIVVIAGGGGGVPVVLDGDGPHGVEGVVDKDLAAVVLARGVGARTLLLLTDVPAVEVGRGTPAARALERLDVASARALIADGTAPAGSMGEKLEAAARFAESGGVAVIAALADAEAAVDGRAGTRVEA